MIKVMLRGKKSHWERDTEKVVNRNNIRGCTCCILLRITKISYQKYSSSFVKSESELMMTDDEWPTIMKQCSLYTTLWWKVERKTNLFHLIKVYTYMEKILTIGAQVILILISGFSHFFSETTLFWRTSVHCYPLQSCFIYYHKYNPIQKVCIQKDLLLDEVDTKSFYRTQISI